MGDKWEWDMIDEDVVPGGANVKVAERGSGSAASAAQALAVQWYFTPDNAPPLFYSQALLSHSEEFLDVGILESSYGRVAR